ncbi:MAG TPA: ABC transporter permease [Thermotogota bacterium]|nr:ABC transporter permease [Thermotogota bacterium]
MIHNTWKVVGAILAKDLKVAGSQGALIVLLLVFPLALGLFYGLMYQNVFDQNITWAPLTVFLLDETGEADQGFIGKVLNVESLPFVQKRIVSSVRGFEESLAEQKDAVGIAIRRVEGQTLIYWHPIGESSLEKSILLQAVEKGIEEYQWQFRASVFLGSEAESFQKVWETFAARPLFREIAREDIRVLSTIEYFLISLFAAFGFMFSTEFLRDREQKLLARAFMAGIGKSTLYWSNFLSNFIIFFAGILVYFAIVFGLILRSSIAIVPFFGIAALQALVVSAFQSLAGGLFKTNKTGLAFILPALFVMLYLGGAFYSVNQEPTMEKIANFLPNYQLFKLYEGLVLGHPYQEASRAFILLAVSTVMAFIGWFAFTKKEVI